VPWRATHVVDLRLFTAELFSTHIGAFVGLDVIVSALVLFVLIAVEGRRVAVPYYWAPVIGTLVVGVSLGLPLFLYIRQVKLDARPA